MRIVIAGKNEVAYNIAEVLSKQYSIVLLGPSQDDLPYLSKRDHIVCVPAEQLDGEAFRAARVGRAQVFVAATGDDERNLIACLSLAALMKAQHNVDMNSARAIKIICLLNQPGFAGVAHYDDHLASFLGISAVVRPARELSDEMIRIANFPGALDVQVFEGGKVQLIRAQVEEGAVLTERPLKHISLPDDVCLLLAKRDEQAPFLPTGTTEFRVGDKITAIGRPEALQNFLSEILQPKKRRQARKKATIIGGGVVGTNVAKGLNESGWSVQVLEQSMERCEQVVQLCPSSILVECANGADIHQLEELDVARSSLVVAVTSSDERNLLVSLLAQYLGVERIITRAARLSNELMFERLGVDVVRSARGAAIRKVVHQIIEKTSVHIELEHGEIELIELRVSETFSAIRLRDLSFDFVCIVGSIMREGSVEIPSGQSEVRPKDRILVVVSSEFVEAAFLFFAGRTSEV